MTKNGFHSQGGYPNSWMESQNRTDTLGGPTWLRKPPYQRSDPHIFREIESLWKKTTQRLKKMTGTHCLTSKYRGVFHGFPVFFSRLIPEWPLFWLVKPVKRWIPPCLWSRPSRTAIKSHDLLMCMIYLDLLGGFNLKTMKVSWDSLPVAYIPII